MSQETIEVVRSVFGAWNAWDMDVVRDLLDPGVILRNPEDFPEPGPFVGRDAVMREWEQLRETWDADSFEFVSDFIDAADRVVVRLMWREARTHTCETADRDMQHGSTEMVPPRVLVPRRQMVPVGAGRTAQSRDPLQRMTGNRASCRCSRAKREERVKLEPRE